MQDIGFSMIKSVISIVNDNTGSNRVPSATSAWVLNTIGIDLDNLRLQRVYIEKYDIAFVIVEDLVTSNPKDDALFVLNIMERDTTKSTLTFIIDHDLFMKGGRLDMLFLLFTIFNNIYGRLQVMKAPEGDMYYYISSHKTLFTLRNTLVMVEGLYESSIKESEDLKVLTDSIASSALKPIFTKILSKKSFDLYFTVDNCKRVLYAICLYLIDNPYSLDDGSMYNFIMDTLKEE